MAITKTNFINYSRCRRYVALQEVKKERLDADISYENYLEEEKKEKLLEMFSANNLIKSVYIPLSAIFSEA